MIGNELKHPPSRPFEALSPNSYTKGYSPRFTLCIRDSGDSEPGRLNGAPARGFQIAVLFSRADLRTPQGGAEERGKDAEVEETSHERQEADHSHDDAAHAVNAQEAPGDEGDACHDAHDAAGEGSHEFDKGVHFLSPIRFEWVSKPSIGVWGDPVCDKVTQTNGIAELPAPIS